MASLRLASAISSLNRISQTTALSTSSRSVINTLRLQPVCRNTVRQSRKFHNAPPRNPWGENPLPKERQYVIFGSGVLAFLASCYFAYATDLFKFKFGEIDWEMIRAEKLDAIREGSEEEEETEAEEVITVSTIEQATEEVSDSAVSELPSEEPVTAPEETVVVEVKEAASSVESSEGESFDKINSEEVKEAETNTRNVPEHQAVTRVGAPVPPKVQYLLIGAGTASVSAMRAILKEEPQAEILIVGDEPYLPYMRPPLSKELWFSKDKEAASQLVFEDWSGLERSLFYPDELKNISELGPGSPALLAGTRVVNLNPNKQTATLSTGETVSYQKCLLAPGGQPKNLPIFEATNEAPCLADKVHLFRNISQFQRLSKELDADKKVLIVGGGFLGSELSYALTKTGAEVYQSFPETGNMGKVLPRYLSQWTMRQLEKVKVKTRPETKVIGVECKGDSVHVTLNTGENIDVDHIVLAVGLAPSTDLGDSAGLEVHPEMGGYVVNSELEARSNLYVAGDAACFYDPVLGRRRIEHHDHAVVSGKLAGRNMTGGSHAYKYQSMFWSDLGPNIGYEAIGKIDSSLPTVGIWAHKDQRTINENPKADEKYDKGIVFYMDKSKVVGVVTWNIFGKIPIARKIIGSLEDQTDFGKLAVQFGIHEKH